jgi:hypothetical protein
MSKLPDKHGYYRMFECEDVFINVEVDELDITDSLATFLACGRRGSRALEDRRPTTLGHWNKAIHIESEGRAISYDFFKSEATSRHVGSYFEVRANRNPRRTTVDGLPVDDVVSASITIAWSHSVHGKQSVSLDHYENPQVQNGMTFTSQLLHNAGAVGMLVRNYKVKYMSLGSLSMGECRKLRKRLRKATEAGASVTHERPVQAKGETWYYARDGRVLER